MVDGVLTSCYADFHHDIAHITMMPLQMFLNILHWIFRDDTGHPVYVSTARELGLLMLPEGHFWN